MHEHTPHLDRPALCSTEYQERYCAFVDILGFRQLVDSLKYDVEEFKILRNLLARVHSPKSRFGAEKSNTDFRAQSISDAVAVSTTVTPEGLLEIFDALSFLAVDLLVEGYFLCGAIVRAPLFHDDQMVFGEGLVKAYSFESEIARYPRIVVTKEVRDDIVQFAASKERTLYPKAEFLRSSSDGPMYLDVLRPIVDLLKKRDQIYKQLDTTERADAIRYRGIKDLIQTRFEQSMDNPRHFEKVRWFANYWNEVVPDISMQVRMAR